MQTLQKIAEHIGDFLSRQFEVSTTKRSRITAYIITAVLLLIVIWEREIYTSQTFPTRFLLLAFALVAPFIIGAVIAFRIRIKNHLFNTIWHFCLLFLMPFVTITMTECLNSIFIYDMTYLGFLGNYVVVLLFYFLFYAATGSYRVSIIAVNTILFPLALAHCYLMEFRGTPLVPMDFLSVTTAAGVANTYNYAPTFPIITAALIYIFTLALGIRMNTPKSALTFKISTRVFTGTFFAVLVFLFYGTSVFADAGVKPDFWNQARGYRNYGFTFNFFCNTKYLYMSEPSGYDPDKVPDYVASVLESSDSTPDSEVNPNTENLPNIICIMNESLSDLQALGDFTTNQDYMPFMHSLTENTVRGNLYVPVIGAGTSNTEFEFLTGHSTAFLPSGSNAYMLYIKQPIASLVSTLEGQGYSSFALHPYYSVGWNRVSVYNFMGFNLFRSIEDIMDTSLMNEYVQNGNNPDFLQSLIDQYYPGKNMLIRQYISDAYNYEELIRDFESRDRSQPYFAFNVTMQNHGGYAASCVNFDESVYVTSSLYVYPKANRYLSLVKASDTAFEELINYFKGVDEPTVICMFGDHQPSIETQFISEVLGVSNLSSLTLEQEQSRHVTPFIIWANFDIEEREINRLSSNYLASLVLDTAGVQLTEYNKYLLKLSEHLPVIDTVGYIDAQDHFYRWNDHSEYTELLNEYERIQYNNIFDSANKDLSIFYIDGYTGDENTEDTEDSEASTGTE